MALVAAGALSRNAPIIECVKFFVFNGKSLLRPQAKAFVVPSATIVSKAYQGENFRPKPWPYKQKGYNLFYSLWETTQWRFNENTKLIVVDGPMGSGKTTLAKQIADDLDMCYFPEPSADMWYTNEYGFNLRELNSELPKSARFINKEDFYREPNMKTAIAHQTAKNQMGLCLYLEALSHLLNTGQGLVLDSPIFANIATIEALIECGYIRQQYRKYYNDCLFTMRRHILKPHLVIYLDVPVDVVKERIKKRGIDYELDSPLLTQQYLTATDKYYKELYLPECSVWSELLVYDWSHFGDAEVVVEDIELVDFDKYSKYDLKLSDWRLDRERQWGMKRSICTNNRLQLNSLWLQPHSDIPEMFMPYEDWDAQRQAVSQHPTGKYAAGYNAAAGDRNIFFKTKFFGSRFRGATN